ncbi:actin-like ATPase domain-containing protein [Polyplosphaeria fusca]|uniref:Actin-like ATPase domain-containing protein n=1 Tax=Polyplosphaeria fusca TaxID=682080 RepID=A0A9P4R5Z5_9PLEO|nr:actin-like ATPase domain-containing protein [Polyplosphaeria fusca]
MTTGNQFVLAVDYGTTFTGVAWAQKNIEGTITFDKVKVFKKWPKGRTESKVPSAISYAWSPKGCVQWGPDIDEDSRVFQWTKMELLKRSPVKELKTLKDLVKDLSLIKEINGGSPMGGSKGLPEHLTKSPEDVITDYLMKVSREFYNNQRSAAGRHTLEHVPLDLVITHPVNWPYDALNKTFRAVMSAFPRRWYGALRDVYLMTEPEACSAHTVAELSKQSNNPLLRGDCFVLADCGGGTIDVASYLVESFDPLKLVRVGSLKGRECGATFIDRAFLDYCSKKLKKDDILKGDSSSGGHFVVSKEGRLLLDEFERHKRAFDGSKSAEIEVSFESDSADVSDTGALPLSAADLKEMFDPSVNGALEMIQKQVFEVRNTKYNGGPCYVSTIFLAGGLSANDYLVSKIEHYARGQDSMAVRRATDGWSAVVRGAVLTGAGIGAPLPPRVSQAPRNYGICLSHVYQEWSSLSPDEVVVDSFDGRHMVRDTMTWLIRQGDLILPGQPLKKVSSVELRFTGNEHATGRGVIIPFVAARDGANERQEAPTKMSEISKNSDTVINMDLSVADIDTRFLPRERSQKGRTKYYTAMVEVRLRVYKDVKLEVYCGDICIYSNVTPL